jgi:ribonuclease HI
MPAAPDDTVTIATDISIRRPSNFVGSGYLSSNGYYGMLAHPQPWKISGPQATDVAELRAVLYALRAQSETCRAIVLCDSQNAVDYMLQWQVGRMCYPPGYNLDRNHRKSSLQTLAELLLAKPNQFTIRKVQGHAGHPLNEAADYLAKLAMNVANLNVDQDTAINLAELRLPRALAEFRARPEETI